MIEESKRNLGIPISSINVPSIQMTEDILRLNFLNWQDQIVQVEFVSTFAFRWVNVTSSNDLDDDKAFEVLNSAWLREVPIGDKAFFHHYQFSVSGCCLFEVIAEGLEIDVREAEAAKISWATCQV